MVPLFYCSNVLWFYCSIVLLFYCSIVLMFYGSIVKCSIYSTSPSTVPLTSLELLFHFPFLRVHKKRFSPDLQAKIPVPRNSLRENGHIDNFFRTLFLS